jgi:hypothetical protein
MLYYVFHKRNLNKRYIPAHADAPLGDNRYYVRASPVATGEPLVLSPNEFNADHADTDDFPEWEYTPYDNDVWDYFSYKLAAALIPKLRMDDGAAGRVQALEQIAAQKGEAAMQRSVAAASNPISGNKWWPDELGLKTHYGQNNNAFTRRF